ncbi:MAG: hypothetical protein HY046_03575 [Acidobacteria bacterium]|nr:hypothetical protein [Acidobacteriota bacterium]
MSVSIIPATQVESSAVKPWVLPAQSLTVLYGSPKIGKLSHYFLPGMLRAGNQVLYLDGANRFDPLLIARLARHRGLEPSEFNRHIRVARAFTCFQLTELLRRVPRVLEKFPAALLVVTGLPDLYFDEDIRDREACVAFERALENLRHLTQERLSVGVFSDAASLRTPRRLFFRELLAQAHLVLRIETKPDNQLAFIAEKSTSRLPK